MPPNEAIQTEDLQRGLAWMARNYASIVRDHPDQFVVIWRDHIAAAHNERTVAVKLARELGVPIESSIVRFVSALRRSL